MFLKREKRTTKVLRYKKGVGYSEKTQHTEFVCIFTHVM